MKSLLLLPGMAEVFATSAMNDYRLNECYDRWDKSKSMPRKKKKLERKHILLDYSFCSNCQIFFKHLGL